MNETIDKLKELLENDKKTIEENYKEIERQKEIIRQLDIKNLELTTILKEVREFIYKCNDGKQGINYSGCSKLLEILDKVDKENNNEDN